MKALIDADVLCYSIGSCEDDHPVLKDAKGDPVKLPISSERIRDLVDEKVKQIAEEAGCSSYTCFLSGSYNFRVDVATTYPYKGRRQGQEKPYHHATVYNHIKRYDTTVVCEKREADDGLADAQTHTTVICTIDKDLDMVEGLHYNWNKEAVYSVSFEEGYYWFCKQLLTGDWSTDSILGCARLVDKVYGPKAAKAGQQYQAREGIGPKKADTLLSAASSPIGWLEIVADQYKKMFGEEWEDKINEMGALLWMGGSPDNLWTYNKAIQLLKPKEETNEET